MNVNVKVTVATSAIALALAGGLSADAQTPNPGGSTIIPESWRLADHLTVEIQPRSSRLATLAVLTLAIRNSSDIWLKDATIQCEFYGESGTRVGDAKRTAYREFAPKKRTIVREMNFGFANDEARSAACKVTSVERGSPV